MTRMLTKARELSGAEDRHNGRKEARTRGTRSSHIKHPSLPFQAIKGAISSQCANYAPPWPIPAETETILTGGEGGWSRISAPVSLWHPRVSLRQHGGSVEEQAGALHAGKGWERACGSLRQPGGEGGPYRSGPFVMRLPSLWVRLKNSSCFIHIICWESSFFFISIFCNAAS